MAEKENLKKNCKEINVKQKRKLRNWLKGNKQREKKMLNWGERGKKEGISN